MVTQPSVAGLLTDAHLIEQSRGTPEHFTAIFDRHYRNIYAYVARRLGPDLAEDVASETFLIAFDRRHGLLPRPSQGGVMADPEALAGQYVLPSNVKAAIYRYLAQQPGMKVNPAAVNLDGHPAIGLGRVVEGYLSQELLFDKQTYALIGERMIAVTDHVNRGDDGTSYTHKGDLFRQVIYRKMIIVDRPGDLS